jgi:hypothetical protein
MNENSNFSTKRDSNIFTRPMNFFARLNEVYRWDFSQSIF